MDYRKYARELIGYMIENEQAFKFCHRDISEIARGECAVLIYLMDGDGVNASEISKDSRSIRQKKNKGVYYG